MTLVKRTTALMIVLCSALSAAPLQRGGDRADGDVRPFTGILQGVDVRRGTFTLEQVGADVDEALGRMLKERGKKDRCGGSGTPQAADAAKTQVVAIGAKTKIFIKFRTSPSVANNVEQELKDLQPMVGYPVTVEIGQAGEPPVASEVVVWCGTPWK